MTENPSGTKQDNQSLCGSDGESVSHRLRNRRDENRAVSFQEKLPPLVLIATLLIFSLSVLYPSSAFPVHGLMTAFLLTSLLAICALFTPLKNSFTPGKGPVALGLLVAVIGWGTLWFARLESAPVYTKGRPDVIIAILSTVAFLVPYYALSNWRSEDFSEQGNGEANPLAIATGWLAVIMTLFGLYGIYQVLGPEGAPKTYATMMRDIREFYPSDDPMGAELLAILENGRASGTFGAANIFGSLCVVGFVLSLSIAIAYQDMKARIGFLSSAGLLLIATVLSGSRGGLVALAGGTMAFALLAVGWVIICRLRRGVLYALAAMTFLVLVGGLSFIISQDLSGESRWFNASGLNQRLYYWTTAVQIWSENPLLGMGPGSFEVFYPQFRIAGANETLHAHSWFFQFAASLGVVGVALFLAIVLLAVIETENLLQRFQAAKEKRNYLLVAGLAAGALALLIHGMIEYTFAFRETAVLFFLLVGILSGTAGNPMELRAKKDCEGWSYKQVPFPLIVGAIALTVLYVCNVPMVRGYWYREAANGAMMDGAAAPEILDLYNEAIKADPSNDSYREARGILRQQLGRPTAHDDFEAAIALNPYSARLQETMARYFSSRGEYGKALEYQQRSIELHPLDISHHLTLVELYRQQGDMEAARRTLTEASGLMRPRKQEDERFARLAAELRLDELQ